MSRAAQTGGQSCLICGDATKVLADLSAGVAHMAYLDPPFGTQRDWHGAAGSFSDRFHLDISARRTADALRMQHPSLVEMIEAFPIKDQAKAYLYSMAAIISAVRRSLAMTGSMWLHCDDTSGAYLKICADFIFGHTAWLGDIVWRRTAAHNDARTYGRVHDTIFVYGRSRVARWRLWRLRSEFALGDPCSAFCVAGFADDRLNPSAKERVGYPTQKPVGLLTRFVLAATLPGEMVLDPTCGSGTAAVAAILNGRRSIAIDRSRKAIDVAAMRIQSVTPRQQELFAA